MYIENALADIRARPVVLRSKLAPKWIGLLGQGKYGDVHHVYLTMAVTLEAHAVPVKVKARRKLY